MSGYLICEDGPLAEWVFTFDDGDSWSIGRDGDSCTFVLEDPMVSRKHLSITEEAGTYYIQNESTTNPALLNDDIIEEKSALKEDDLVQIGNNIFRFATKLPEKKEEEGEAPLQEVAAETTEEPEKLTLGSFLDTEDKAAKWLLKVINGPGAGASFSLSPSASYVIGSDSSADILLHDLSVSKNHARITTSPDGESSIEDLNSRNGVFVDGRKVETSLPLGAKDLITLGTTSLLFIDLEQTRDTIYSPSVTSPLPKEESLYEEKEDKEEEKTEKSWKDTFISTKLLAGAAVFSVFISVGVISLLALFKSTDVERPIVDRSKEIESELANFTDVEFNFNPDTSILFLSGHVLTEVDYNELLYRLGNLSYVSKTEDNVVIDELVSENMNALIMKNPAWNSVLMTSRTPGEFLLTGYVKTEEEKVELTDFINKYFNYLNLLQNKIVVENTLDAQIQNVLMQNALSNVLFQQNTGRVILSGRAHESQKPQFEKVSMELSRIHGVRVVKNFVVFTTESTVAIDLTSKYSVTGTSKFGDQDQFVLINGKILGTGDTLDGMTINKIANREIHLSKSGVKYKIDFNE